MGGIPRLNKLSVRAEKLNCKKIAMPYKIGCGLAGGNWDIYKAIINDWVQQNQNKFKVIFVQNNY